MSAGRENSRGEWLGPAPPRIENIPTRPNPAVPPPARRGERAEPEGACRLGDAPPAARIGERRRDGETLLLGERHALRRREPAALALDLRVALEDLRLRQ